MNQKKKKGVQIKVSLKKYIKVKDRVSRAQALISSYWVMLLYFNNEIEYSETILG